MTPQQFLSRLKKQIPPAVLLLGCEAYQRQRVREGLIDAVLTPEQRADGLAEYDLGECSLGQVIDDAQSLSLFAADRVILVRNAEKVLPKGKAAEASDDDEEGSGGPGDAGVLNAYMRNPSPGVTLVFEATRFEWEGEDKKKLERVQKFFAAIPDVVELKRYSPDEARQETVEIARKAGVSLDRDALDVMVEALAADVARIAVEIEKLSLFAGASRPITADDITSLVPDARSTTIFVLVNALGRRDRARSLQVLDTLTKEGEYLPLALSFLSSQFRMALIAREAGLKSSQQIMSHFSRMGIAMWSSRAEQVQQTVAKFSKDQLQRALRLIFEADRNLRSARPDDRVIMEQFVLELAA